MGTGTQLRPVPSGAFEIEINGQLVFSKLENGGFPYEKDVSTHWGQCQAGLGGLALL